MAGKDNLVPVRSEEEARAKGKKGGIASGKARREKKAMRETLNDLLSLPLQDGKVASLEKIKSLAALKGKNITVQEAIMLSQIQKAMKGDTRAAEYIRDTIGEKPGMFDMQAEEYESDGFIEALREGAKVWQE